MKSYYVIWIIIAAIAAATQVLFVKYYTDSKDLIWIIFSVISHLCMVFAYSIILIDTNMAVIYAIIKVLSILIIMIIGIISFKHTLDIRALIGIALGMASIYLLSTKT